MFIKSFINSFYFIDYVLIRQIIKIHLVLGKIKEIIFIQKKKATRHFYFPSISNFGFALFLERPC